jgi:hypothetical protein
MNPYFPRTLAVASFLLGACSSSSPHETPDAGHKNDAAHDAGTHHEASHTVDASDASTATDATDASDATDAHDAAPVPVFTLDAGCTWTDLYRDYFGNPATASCAGNGGCHGSPSQPGYANSMGYLCPADASTVCWASMTSADASGPDLITPDASFANDYLSMVLCQVNDAGMPVGDGVMPEYCTYNFTPVDMQRIHCWVEAGAPNN